jgi:hypothetical protein
MRGQEKKKKKPPGDDDPFFDYCINKKTKKKTSLS